jgi:hypothetical protein
MLKRLLEVSTYPDFIEDKGQHGAPSVRTVLVNGGVPFTFATWVIAVVRFASLLRSRP